MHLLALVVLLKCFQRLGYFQRVEEIPAMIIQRVRGCLELPADISAAHDSGRTLRHHKTLIRARLGVRFDPEQAREVAGEAIRTAAEVKDNPADLINVALEELIRARCELPGYTTLDELAARVRGEVNGGIFRGIGGRMTDREWRPWTGCWRWILGRGGAGAIGSSIIDSALLVIAVVVGLIGVAGIFNTLPLNTRERVRDTVVLQAVGMSPRQVLAVVAASAAQLALAGGVLALPAGLGVHRLLLDVISNSAGNDTPPITYAVFNPLELVVIPLLGMIVA